MKIKKSLSILLLLSILLAACNTLKTIKLLKNGDIIQKEFKVEIPFEYRLGLIILKVNIKGNEYDFLLDTGAPNVISKELAEKLGLTSSINNKIEDSQNNESELSFVEIDNINIGGLDFINTGAAISDLSISMEVSCLKIDGIIGSNLMKKAIWKFDYQNQIITITNTMDSFKISPDVEKISFYPEITGTPLCDIKVNNHIEKDIVIDLGSNGNITLSTKTYDKLIKNNDSISKITLYGENFSGIFGTGVLDTTQYVIVSDIEFGDIVLTNSIIEFSYGSPTIGMNFFKNYDIIINWFTKEVLLQKRKEYDYSTITNFGFNWHNVSGELIVSTLIMGSIAEKNGLKINDQIIAINGDDYSKISIEQWCEMIEKANFKNEIDITILRNEKKLTFHFYNENLLK